MDIKTLKTFLSVARLKNFSAAARELNTVQPTVSRHISELESELGIKLFLRTTHQVKLTLAAEALVPEALNIICNDKRVKELIANIETTHAHVINIGYLATACSFFLPNLIVNFTSLNPNVITNLYEMTVEEQLEALLEDRIDIALSRRQTNLDSNTYAVEKIYSDKPMAILPADHPLAKKSELSIDELLDERFIFFRRTDWLEMYEHIQFLFQERGYAPNIIFQPNNMRHLVTSVAAGLGISIIPSCVKFITNKNCVCIPVKEISLMWPLYMYYKRNRLDPSRETLIQMFLEKSPDIENMLFQALTELDA